MTGVILAGGKSRRLGRDKVLLSVGGRNLLERTCQLFHEIFSEVVIVTNSPLEFFNSDAEIFTDLVPGCGPLGGIFTGLVFSTHPHSFVTACDMPFLNRDLIQYLISLKDDYDVVMPQSESGYETMHAVYSRQCLKVIKASLDEGELKVDRILPKIRTRMVGPSELRPYLEGITSPFFNINTPQDLEEARKLGET